MKRQGMVFLTGLTFIFLVTASGCAQRVATTPGEPSEYPEYAGKGYLIELGDIKEGTFDTPPYLPAKIRYQLAQDLKERGLLAPPTGAEKRLIANVTVSASYPYYTPIRRCEECYGILTSRVDVVDPSNSRVIAETVIRSYNAWSRNLSDNTELTNAEEIARFLEGILHSPSSR